MLATRNEEHGEALWRYSFLQSHARIASLSLHRHHHILHTRTSFLIDIDTFHICCHSYSGGKAVLVRVPRVCFSALSVTSDVAWVTRLDALMHLACSFLDPSLPCSIKASLITTATCCWYNGSRLQQCSCLHAERGKEKIHKLLIKTNWSHERRFFLDDRDMKLALDLPCFCQWVSLQSLGISRES